MIPQEKINEICRRLLAKSRAGQVKWLELSESRFGVHLPAGDLEIEFYSPQTEPDGVQVTVKRPDGRQVGGMLVSEGDEEWPLFFNLFQDAERCVTGWDQVLTGIEAAIGAEGPIGTIGTSNVPTSDVPF